MYRNLSDAELLNQLNDKRYHSPVVDELCKRLEAKTLNEKMTEGIEKSCNSKVDCPICLATLTVDFDDANSMLGLNI